MDTKKAKEKIIKEMIKFYQERIDETSKDIQKNLLLIKKLANKMFRINRRAKTINLETEKEILSFYNFMLEAEMKPRRNGYALYKAKIRKLKEENQIR